MTSSRSHTSVLSKLSIMTIFMIFDVMTGPLGRSCCGGACICTSNGLKGIPSSISSAKSSYKRKIKSSNSGFSLATCNLTSSRASAAQEDSHENRDRLQASELRL